MPLPPIDPFPCFLNKALPFKINDHEIETRIPASPWPDYLDIPTAKVVGNLMPRHMAGGKSEEEAREWVKKNDLSNARLIKTTRANAHVLIERDLEASDLTRITWPNPP